MAKKTKQLAPRPCAHCGLLVRKLTRVRTQDTPDWVLVCDACWPRFHEQRGYTYGGVWKAAKRR